MKHTNLREEIMRSMEYSKDYTNRQRKVDMITWGVLVGLVVLIISLITL